MESSDRDAIWAVLDSLVEKMQADALHCEDCPCFLSLDALGEPEVEGWGLCVKFGHDDMFVTRVEDGPCDEFEREVVGAMRARRPANV